MTLRARAEGRFVVVAVQDTGIGIAPYQCATLFETFRNSEHETSSNYGEDAGLGLPLAYRYCRLMGGELTVESRLGRGSRFVIRLPVRLPSGSEHETLPGLADRQAA